MQKEAEGYGLKSQIKLIFWVCACERLIFHSTQSFFLHRALVIGGLVSCDDRGGKEPPISRHSSKRWQTNPSAGEIGWGKRNLTVWTDDQSIDSGWFSRLDLIEECVSTGRRVFGASSLIRNKMNYVQNMLAVFAFDALQWLKGLINHWSHGINYTPSLNTSFTHSDQPIPLQNIEIKC